MYPPYLAPVPLSIFRSNSKFDENSKHSSVKYTRPITTIFCTRHDSVTVVTCAKYRCDRSSIFKTRTFWIFIELLVGRAPGKLLIILKPGPKFFLIFMAFTVASACQSCEVSLAVSDILLWSLLHCTGRWYCTCTTWLLRIRYNLHYIVGRAHIPDPLNKHLSEVPMAVSDIPLWSLLNCTTQWYGTLPLAADSGL